MDQEKHERRLTNDECGRLRLPGRSPFEPYEELDWFALETPAQIDIEAAAIAGTILGDGAAA
jgi:hypothetical protein